MSSSTLSDRQKLILRVVARRSNAGRPAPSFRELGVLMSPSAPVSTSVVRYHIDRLIDRGLLSHDDRVARSLAVTPLAAALHPDLVSLSGCSALVDAVRAAHAAGEPLPSRVLAALEAVPA